jgi:hypothetical protein
LHAVASAPDSDRIDIVGEELPPLLEPGIYQATGGKARVATLFRTLKLCVAWCVLMPDLLHGHQRVTLTRYYNIKRGPGRRWRAGASSHYIREWTLVTGRRPSRGDPLSPAVFRGVLAEIEVRTVTSDSRQHDLAVPARYSVVARIIKILAGGGVR